MRSHTTRRIQVHMSSDAIMAKQTTIPRIGTRGTRGVLYGRGRLGLVRRMIITPAHTMTNASNVPMLTISPRVARGTRPEKRLTNTMKMRLQRHGVLYLGWMSEKSFGSRPSRDME